MIGLHKNKTKLNNRCNVISKESKQCKMISENLSSYYKNFGYEYIMYSMYVPILYIL